MKNLPSLKQLQYLIALHDHQHFGQAAAACFVSQSTLSAAIINLEETLDAQLLERDHKTFLFTPLGEAIVKRSRLIVEQCSELSDYAKTQGKPLHGKFYLGIIPTIAPFVLDKLQTVCKQQYPDLNLYVREDTTENTLQLLKEGKLDLVLLALPYPTGDVHTRILCRDYFQLVIPKSWHDKNFNKTLEQLPTQSIFLLEKEHCLTGHALQACHLNDSQKINPFFATSLHTLIQMVSHQPGITYLPTLAINHGLLKGTDLIAIPLQDNNAFREIGVVWRKTSHKIESYELLSNLIEKLL